MAQKSKTLKQIAKRYHDQLTSHGFTPPMDQEGVIWLLKSVDRHCALDFEKLLSFDDFSFMHDVCGMCDHAEFPSGKLKNLFLPRCAAN